MQGGLAGLEELAQVIALNNNNEQGNEPMDEEHDETAPALEFPVRNPSDSSPSLDSDEGMTDSDNEPGSSDDEAMEEIAMDEEPPLSPIPFSQALPQTSPGVQSSPEVVVGSPDSQEERSPATIQAQGSSPDSESSGMTSRSSGRGSRRSSRSRRRTTLESSREALLPIGEQLKFRLLNEDVLCTMIVGFLFIII